MAKEKNLLCSVCKKEIELADLSMIELAEALDGIYIHPECRTEKEETED